MRKDNIISNKIAIIIPTLERDNLLVNCLYSIFDNWEENFLVIVLDQNIKDSSEKQQLYNLIANPTHYKNPRLEVIRVPYNTGISKCRNIGVEAAKELNCDYCLISADSIFFNESTKQINNLLTKLEIYDILGIELKNRIPIWHGYLNLIPNKCFELDFINIEKQSPNLIINSYKNNIGIWDVDIHHNFFLAKTETLLNNKWDDNLLCREHEDWMYSTKLKGLKKGWTNYCNGEYIKDNVVNPDYKGIRQKNMNDGLKYLLKKWNITRWVTYKNLPKK